MPPFAAALIDFGHLLGVLLLAGGLLHLGFVALPAGNQLEQDDRERFAAAMRWRGRTAMLVGIALLIGTGLTKWAPGTGVGWIGHGGIRTAFLHGKLVLALVLFHFAIGLTRKPSSPEEATRRPRRARGLAMFSLLIVALAVLHKTGV